MKRVALFAATAMLLAGCAGTQITPPAQPTPSVLSSALGDLSAISADPVTVWQAGDYSVHMACDAYLNQVAMLSAKLSFGSTALGLAGAAGSIANPLVGVGTTIAQGFLSAYQASGAAGLPYSPETTALIQDAMAAYENAVAPPTSVPVAALDVEGLWWQCTPAGYAELATKAISTAQVSASSGAAPTAAVPRALMVAPSGVRPRITVNGR